MPESKGICISISEDDLLTLQELEALGIITNRSAWVCNCIRELAGEGGIGQVLDRETAKLELRLAELHNMRSEQQRRNVEKELMWDRVVRQFCQRRDASHQADVNWLKSRRKEIKACRPGKSFEEVLGELQKMRDDV